MSVLTPQNQRTEGSTASPHGVLPSIRKVHSKNTNGRSAAAAAVGDSWDLYDNNSQQPTQRATARLTLLSMPTQTQPTQQCRLEAKIPLSTTSLPPSLLADSAHKAVRRVALSDFIARRLQVAISRSPSARFFGIRTGPIGSFCIETNWVCICPADEGNGDFNIQVIFEISAAAARAWTLDQDKSEGGSEGGDRCAGYHDRLFGGVVSVIKDALVACEDKLGDGEGLDVDEARLHVEVRGGGFLPFKRPRFPF